MKEYILKVNFENVKASVIAVLASKYAEVAEFKRCQFEEYYP
jgi:hypothetical protein